MEVITNAPGIQFYTGNALAGQYPGKSGRTYAKHIGFCLEIQCVADTPNHPQFPSTRLEPGETWTSSTSYRFGKE